MSLIVILNQILFKVLLANKKSFIPEAVFPTRNCASAHTHKHTVNTVNLQRGFADQCDPTQSETDFYRALEGGGDRST
jgi:hypothetical protein